MAKDALPEAAAYLVKGSDPALLGTAVRNLLESFINDESVEEFADPTGTIEPIIDACVTPPFFGTKRVVVVRDIGRFMGRVAADADDEDEDDSDETEVELLSSGSPLERILAYLAEPLDTTLLIMVAGGGRLSPKLSTVIKKVGKIIDTDPPRPGKALATWTDARLLAGPVRLDAAAASAVKAHLGENIGRLDDLLDRLAATFGEGAKLKLVDVEPHLGSEGAVPSWDLTDAIDSGNTEAAIHVLRRMLNAGERHPLAVLASLQGHYERMLRLEGSMARNENDAAALLGISPFPASKALRQVNRLGYNGVSRAIVLLHEADISLKGAKEVSEDVVLDVCVARLSKLVSGGVRR